MDVRLPTLYRDYGLYSNWRNLPLSMDGLKPVERRVLFSAYKIAREKLVKTRQIDAYCIGHYHPHGECSGTVAQLVRQGFLDGQGNFGSSVGIEPVGPAAPRYTECKLSKKTFDLAFKYIKYSKFINTELGDTEPEFLPTMFPICLMGIKYTEGIGFGYKTFIPCYSMKDLYKRLLWLLGLSKIKPTIIPITDCKILSKPDVLEELLTTGQAKIEAEGIIDINPRNSTITLKSWPPGKRFETILNKFDKELSENMIGFSDLSSEKTEIVFQVLRERNRTKIFEEFVIKMKEVIKGSISFEMVMIDLNNKVVVKSVDNMLLDTYNMFCNINKEMLNQDIDSLNTTINEYKLLEKIKMPLSKCLGDGFDIDLSIDIINKSTGIDKKDIVTLIDKYRIKKLLTLNTDTTELENKVNINKNHLTEPTKFVLNQYNELF